jgi:hypothetical protein
MDCSKTDLCKKTVVFGSSIHPEENVIEPLRGKKKGKRNAAPAEILYKYHPLLCGECEDKLILVVHRS